MKPSRNLVENVIRAWKDASDALAIEVVAPYERDIGRITTGRVIFLPHFGGPQGMVIGLIMPPDFNTDRRLIDFAKNAGLFYSFINPETYGTFESGRFKEALIDWGYFGPKDKRPPFLS